MRAFLDVKAIGATSLEELAKILRPYMLRRLKTDVERTLPPKTEMIIDVALTSVQKQYYRYGHGVGSVWSSGTDGVVRCVMSELLWRITCPSWIKVPRRPSTAS